jgi:hypothetical protein
MYSNYIQAFTLQISIYFVCSDIRVASVYIVYIHGDIEYRCFTSLYSRKVCVREGSISSA